MKKEFLVELMNGIILDDSIKLIKTIEGVFAFATADGDRYAVGNISFFYISDCLYACFPTYLVTSDYVTFVISDSHEVYEFVHERNKTLRSPKCSKDIITDLSDFTTSFYWLETRTLYFVKLPDGFDVEHFSIEIIRFNNKNYLRTSIPESVNQLKRLLSSFSDRYFLPLDINYELCKVWVTNLVDESIERFGIMCQGFSPVDIDESLLWKFRVPAKYNKDYYCAAMISRIADRVECDGFAENYYLIINGSHVEELYLMQNNFDLEFVVSSALSEYLGKRYLPAYIEQNISAILMKIEKRVPWYGMWPFSTLLYALREERKFRWNCYYKLAESENRIATKWVHEYRLYMRIKYLFPDAIHQYRAKWLGAQSLDIYIPSLNTGIEYQGEQHFKPVDFGKDEDENDRFEESLQRDALKRKLCSDNYVRLLEWSYERHIDHNSVVFFLRENGIECSSVNRGLHTVDYEMAPKFNTYVPKRNKHKKEIRSEEITHLIRKYSSEGKYIATYLTADDAAIANNLSSAIIKRICTQGKGLAGGCQWRRVLRDAPIRDIEPVIRGQAVIKQAVVASVLQIDPVSREIVAEFETQKKASRSVGVSVKEILEALRDDHKIAGGYYWKYASDVVENDTEDIKVDGFKEN